MPSANRSWRSMVKLLATLVLAASFFMPVTQCTRPALEGPENVQSAESRFDQYPYTGIEWDDPGSWIVLAAYFWPTLFLITANVRGQRIEDRFPVAGSLVQVALCGVSLYVITVLATFGSARYGAWVGGSTVAAYLTAAMASLITTLRACKGPSDHQG